MTGTAPAVTATLRHLLLGAFSAAALCAAPAVCAPGQAAPAPLPPGFGELKASHALASLARRDRDPWGLAIAARLRAGASGAVRAEAGEAHVEAADLRREAEDWLDQAERWGQGDPRLLSLVRDIRGEAPKGRLGGPRVSTARLGGGGRHRYAEPFIAGVPAVVYLEGDGDAALGLTVSAANGRVACQQAGEDAKLCAWTPRASETYQVEVANAGPVEARYALGTN